MKLPQEAKAQLLLLLQLVLPAGKQLLLLTHLMPQVWQLLMQLVQKLQLQLRLKLNEQVWSRHVLLVWSKQVRPAKQASQVQNYSQLVLAFPWQSTDVMSVIQGH